MIGILATIAAALLTGGKGGGERRTSNSSSSARSRTRRRSPCPEQRPKMQLIDGKIQATGTNVAGYSLFRVLNIC